MASLIDKVEIPWDGEESTHSDRHMKDSSNDSDSYEDSSAGDEGSYQCSRDSDNEGECGGPSDENKKTAPSTLAKISKGVGKSASGKPSIADSKHHLGSIKTFIKCSLMEMNEEERIYFEENEKTVAEDQLLSCTNCLARLFLSINSNNIRIHPALGVLLCKSCLAFYLCGPFVQDANGIDEYCRWCAQGGQVICCDTCPHVFCKACLRKCFNRDQLHEIQEPGMKWSCLTCNKQPIWSERALSRNVLSTLHNEKISRSERPLRRRFIAGQPNDPFIWLPGIITEAEELSRNLKMEAKKIETLWSKEVADQNPNGGNSSADEEATKKKVIDCCRKLREAVDATRFGMELLEEKMEKKYALAYGNDDDLNAEYLDAGATAVATMSNTPKDENAEESTVNRENNDDAGIHEVMPIIQVSKEEKMEKRCALAYGNDDDLNDDDLNDDDLNADDLNADDLNADDLNAEHLNAEHLNAEHLNAEHLNAEHLDTDTTAVTTISITPKEVNTEEGTANRKNNNDAGIRDNMPIILVKHESLNSSLVVESSRADDTELFSDASSCAPDEKPDVKTEIVEGDSISINRSANVTPDIFEGLYLQSFEEESPVKEETGPYPVDNFSSEVEESPRQVKEEMEPYPIDNFSSEEQHPDSSTELSSEKENEDENETDRMLSLQHDDDSESSDEIFQRVKADTTIERLNGVPLALDDPKLNEKCQVSVNRLSLAVRFCVLLFIFYLLLCLSLILVYLHSD